MANLLLTTLTNDTYPFYGSQSNYLNNYYLIPKEDYFEDLEPKENWLKIYEEHFDDNDRLYGTVYPYSNNGLNIGWYIRINGEWLRVNNITTHNTYFYRIWLDRGIYQTIPISTSQWENQLIVEFYDGVPTSEQLINTGTVGSIEEGQQVIEQQLTEDEDISWDVQDIGNLGPEYYEYGIGDNVFIEEIVGSFGVPGVDIINNPSLKNSYNPYAGINITLPNFYSSCIEDSIDILTSRASGFIEVTSDTYSDISEIQNLECLDTVPIHVEVDNNPTNFRVRCTLPNESWGYVNWNKGTAHDACSEAFSYDTNSERYWMTDEDGRPSLGLFSTKDNNPLQDDFRHNISDTLFTQIPKPNLINNGTARSVQTHDYFTPSLGTNSFRPAGGWDYLALGYGFGEPGTPINTGNLELVEGTDVCAGVIPCSQFSQYYNISPHHCNETGGGNNCQWEGNQCVPVGSSEGHSCDLYVSCMTESNQVGYGFCTYIEPEYTEIYWNPMSGGVNDELVPYELKALYPQHPDFESYTIPMSDQKYYYELVIELFLGSGYTNQSDYENVLPGTDYPGAYISKTACSSFFEGRYGMDGNSSANLCQDLANFTADGIDDSLDHGYVNVGVYNDNNQNSNWEYMLYLTGLCNATGGNPCRPVGSSNIVVNAFSPINQPNLGDANDYNDDNSITFEWSEMGEDMPDRLFGFGGYYSHIHGTTEGYDGQTSDNEFPATLRHPFEWAKWVKSSECLSYNKCLKFQASTRWDDTLQMSADAEAQIYEYTHTFEITHSTNGVGSDDCPATDRVYEDASNYWDMDVLGKTFSRTSANPDTAKQLARNACNEYFIDRINGLGNSDFGTNYGWNYFDYDGDNWWPGPIPTGDWPASLASDGWSNNNSNPTNYAKCRCDDMGRTLASTYTSHHTPAGEQLAEVNNNEYRVLNQYQKIYEAGDTQLNPYSSLKVSFWMKTKSSSETENWIIDYTNPTTQGSYEAPAYNEENPPYVEVGIMPSEEYGNVDLQQYTNFVADYNSLTGTIKSEENYLGSMGRFKNHILDKWEKFEYTFNLDRNYVLPSDDKNIKSLKFIVQSSAIDIASEPGWGTFRGTVYLDNFEVKESYDFTPDVDVRKKKGPNKYGKASLTKYYDPTIPEQLEDYYDTLAPLEAQFYFYPRYYYNSPLDVEKEIIHNDFREGMFYLYDVDWGDGSPKEFLAEPKLLGENISVHHTYETAGIYEITGTMIRMKPDKDYKPTGIIHNKRFVLRINVNEGSDEDFTYFGSDGFSFIPYKNTLPVIGGVSEQSSYYKSITRQLGIISDTDRVETIFKKQGDRLKTELALDKMNTIHSDKLKLLNEFKEKRTITKPPAPLLGSSGYLLNNYTFNWIVLNIAYLTLPGSGHVTSGQIMSDGMPQVLIDMDNNNYPKEYPGIFESYQHPNGNSYHYSVFGWRQDSSSLKWYSPWLREIIYNEGNSSIGYIQDILNAPIPYDDILTQVMASLNLDTPTQPTDYIFNGIKTHTQELGKSLGDVDLTNIRYYNKPIEMWEQLGFQNEFNDSTHPGKPGSPRYWKDKIIPKNYSIFNRAGLIDTQFINIYSSQEWVDDYYYPVLERHGADGKFIEGDYPPNKIPFPLEGPITDEYYSDDYLKISITSKTVESNIYNDNSGNKNHGFSFNDYKPEFEKETLKPEIKTNMGFTKTKRTGGAF